MRIKLFGTEIYISFLFVALMAVLIATDRTGLIYPMLFAVTIHETAHLFMMWALSCTPKQVCLFPAGVRIVRGITEKVQDEIIIAAAGPLINLFCTGIFVINYLTYGKETTLIYGLTNLAVGLFNLLPVKQLDGGVIIKSILIKKTTEQKADKILTAITIILAVSVFSAGVYLIKTDRCNLSLIIMSIYLFLSAIIKM